MQAKGREKDEELALFFELRRREKENEENINLSSELLDDLSLESGNNEKSPISKCLSALPLQRKSRDELLNSQNEKSDYDWLLTPPGTPLVSMEKEKSQRTETNHIEIPTSRPIALRSRPSNIQVDPASKRNVPSKTPISSSDSHPVRRPTSSDGPKPAPPRRSATPTPRPTVPSITKKPSRSSTPNPRPTRPSTPTRSSTRPSTPTRSSARSSTPTTARPVLPAPNATARSATPTRQPSDRRSASGSIGRASSASKARPASSKGPALKPVEMPGFSAEALPNLKTKLPERPVSASRGRPAGPGAVKSTSTLTGPSSRPRQQSCSPSRTRAPQSSMGNSYRSMTRSMREADEVSPVVMGTRMVERVVNMRKLAPPKREDDRSSSSSGHNSNSGSKSSVTVDSLGLGRTLSKKSLDMALRHMDIRRSVQGNNNNSLRPSVTNIPASSVYSIRSGPMKIRAPNSSASSDSGSEPSVTNNADFESEK